MVTNSTIGGNPPSPLQPAVYIVSVVVMLYSLLCGSLAGLVCYMFVKFDRKSNYICMCAFVEVIACLASFSEQIFYISNQRRIKLAEYENAHQVPRDYILVFAPVLVSQRIFFAIQFYTYSAQSMLALFWAGTLLRNVWGMKRGRNRASTTTLTEELRAFRVPPALLARASIFTLPLIPLIFTFSEGVRQKLGLVPTLICVDFVLCVGLFTAWVLLGVVLFKIVTSQRSFMGLMKNRPAYDKYIGIRFVIAFVEVSICEAALVIYQLLHKKSLDQLSASTSGPDYSSGRAISDILGYLPGNLPSLFCFLIWGTTAHFRQQYAHMFRRCRGRCLGGRAEDTEVTLVENTWKSVTSTLTTASKAESRKWAGATSDPKANLAPTQQAAANENDLRI